MSSIKAIEQDSVRRIHAGQVVLELQGAVKELVENSIDSGATSIDVRFKDNGLDTVEVVDNGGGIAEADWPFIGLKHHTSKLPSLADLPHVTTFGFRGEALSSLCALSDSVAVTTATEETAPMGAVLKMARDGSVADSTGRVARPRGTTITLSGLFVPLPVRRKEFERTIKREFAKTLSLLYAYALVPSSASREDGRPGVRLKVESVARGKGGKRTSMLSTDGRGSLRASVGSIWGPKALEGVLDIGLDLDVEVDPIMARREGLSDQSLMVKVNGLVSSAAWGQGRTSPDRQFLYVNGRPCDLKPVTKAINEVYKSFNSHQVPFIVLDFTLPPESVDINVSPDKRTIFLHSEANLVNALKAALEEFYAPSRSSYPLGGASGSIKAQSDAESPHVDDGKVQNLTTTKPEHRQKTEFEAGRGTEEMLDDLASLTQESRNVASPFRAASNEEDGIRHTSAEEEDDEDMVFEGEVEIISPLKANTQKSSSTSNVFQHGTPLKVVQRTISTAAATWSPERRSREDQPRSSPPVPNARLRKRLEAFASQPGFILPNADDEGSEEQEPASDEEDRDENNVHGSEMEMDDNVDQLEPDDDPDSHSDTSERGSVMASEPNVEHEIFTEDHNGMEISQSSSFNHDIPRLSDMLPGSKRKVTTTNPVIRSPSPDSEDQEHRFPRAGPSTLPRTGSDYRNEVTSSAIQGEMTLRFDIHRLRRRYAHAKRHHSPAPTEKSRNAYRELTEGKLSQAAGISNRDMAQAEEALARVIAKVDFDNMEVLGQFNRGFIVARLHKNGQNGKQKGSDDLFIIDQHACDEKYNFETLQRTTVIKSQTLIKPRALQLTAGDEIVAIENMEVLRANGFEVAVDENKAPGRGERIALSAMPVSKETTFDFTDLEQLLHLLSDGARPAGQMVRCSKARSMFAMRACRRSVMIGRALTRAQMAQLLRNMGTIDQPWNCPHGRPTMRHLTKIEKPKKSQSGRGRVDWSSWSLDEPH